MDVAVSWDESCLARERWEGTIALILTGTLVPAWIAFDVLLEPDWVRPFAAMRLVATAVVWAAFWPVRRFSAPPRSQLLPAFWAHVSITAASCS